MGVRKVGMTIRRRRRRRRQRPTRARTPAVMAGLVGGLALAATVTIGGARPARRGLIRWHRGWPTAGRAQV